VLRDLVNDAMADLESIQNRDSAYTGIPTGFVDLDNLMSGLQPGNLIVVAARPGIGKSSLAMNVARNIAVANEPVAMFSLEMSRMEIGMRLLCAEARVPWDRIRNKRVGPDDWQRVVHAAEILHDAPLSIVDSGNVNIVDIRAKARRMRSSNQGLSLIIVDYLQLMTSPSVRRPDNRQQEVAEISRQLKLLAKELHVPVMALSQLNRNPEARADKRPQLSDLRESGAIEQDSDVVMFIHRDDADPEKKKQAELIVAKHRNGPTDTVRLSFEPSLTQFRNAARDLSA
jgi:replicative DNA helicase